MKFGEFAWASREIGEYVLMYHALKKYYRKHPLLTKDNTARIVKLSGSEITKKSATLIREWLQKLRK